MFVSVQLKNLNLNRALENIIISHRSPGNSLVLYLFPECWCVHVCMRTMCVQCMCTRMFSAVEHVHLTRIPDMPCPSVLPCTPGGLACVWKEGVHGMQMSEAASVRLLVQLSCSLSPPLHHDAQEMNKLPWFKRASVNISHGGSGKNTKKTGEGRESTRKEMYGGDWMLKWNL